MQIPFRLFFSSIVFWVIGCTSNNNSLEKKPVSIEEQVLLNIDTLKQIAQNGDLIVRLTDDILSHQIAFMNEQDKAYSHCGLIVEKENKKYVCHISPDSAGADTIRYIPIDSFINPAKELKCALYRYNFSDSEKLQMLTEIEQFAKAKVHFDNVYDLATNNKLYCSEMIAKALQKATSNRITIKANLVPPRMKKLLALFFKQEKNAKKIINERKFIAIDQLYLIPECRQLVKLNLKTFPGQ